MVCGMISGLNITLVYAKSLGLIITFLIVYSKIIERYSEVRRRESEPIHKHYVKSEVPEMLS